MKYSVYKLFWILSGEDYRIIKRCNLELRKLFGFIGVFVTLIFSLCFLSSYYAFTQLFNNLYIGIPIGLFFAWMITNLYLLLLYTLSKPVLPNTSNTSAKFFSIAVRIAFLIFIAVMMSKPLETMLFKNQLNEIIEDFKLEKFSDLQAITIDYYDQEISEHQSVLSELERLNHEGSSADILFYRKLIADKEQAKDKMINEMTIKISNSNYYIHSVKKLNENYPHTWGITLIVVLLFLSPSIAKAKVAAESQFNREKKKIHKTMVEKDYGLFKEKYTALLSAYSELPKVNVMFTENYLDPPYNTQLKEFQKNPYGAEELKDYIYND